MVSSWPLNVAYNLHCSDGGQVSDLAAGSKQTPLSVRHDKHRGFFVEGLTEQPCATCQEALVFMHKGLTTRHIRSVKPLLKSHDLMPCAIKIVLIKSLGNSLKPSVCVRCMGWIHFDSCQVCTNVRLRCCPSMIGNVSLVKTYMCVCCKRCHARKRL